MRCMVECTQINVLQLFCWPITPSHHWPTLRLPIHPVAGNLPINFSWWAMANKYIYYVYNHHTYVHSICNSCKTLLGCMRCMVKCTPINVLQLFCWPMNPFHNRPTLWSPTSIPQLALKALVAKQQPTNMHVLCCSTFTSCMDPDHLHFWFCCATYTVRAYWTSTELSNGNDKDARVRALLASETVTQRK